MKKRILASLLSLVLVFSLLPMSALAAEEPQGAESSAVTEVPVEENAVYVSTNGSDKKDQGDGTQTKPYATLAKAVEQAEDGATIYVMSDLTLTTCARFYNKSLTITSGEGGPYTVTRGGSFETIQDDARSTRCV